MRVALAIPQIVPDQQSANLAAMQRMIQTAAEQSVELIVFSEAALTGLTNTGDPEHDLALGQLVPGPATNRIGQLAWTKHMWVGFGLFERDHDELYDSAVLVDPEGNIRLTYRRIDPHWHHWHSRPCSNMIYQPGTEFRALNCRWAKVHFCCAAIYSMMRVSLR